MASESKGDDNAREQAVAAAVASDQPDRPAQVMEHAHLAPIEKPHATRITVLPLRKSIKWREQQPYAAFIVELVGTFFIAFVASLSPFPALGVGSALVATTYMGKHLSGAMFNPAITLASFLHHRISRQTMLGYIFVQLVGAFFGAFAANAVVDGNVDVPNIQSGYEGRAFLVSFFYSAMLVWVYLMTTRKLNVINSFSGMAVGFTFIGLAGTAFYQHGSGAILNPAVALAHLAVNGSTAQLNDIWVYLLAPLIGALGGAFFTFFTINRLATSRLAFPYFGPFLTEGLCTGVLCFAIASATKSSVVTSTTSAPIYIAFLYAGFTYAAQDVSGAHFNPAVTIATFLSQSPARVILEPVLAGGYVVVQIVSAILGALVYATIDRTWALPSTSVSEFRPFLQETLLVMLLVFVFLSTTTILTTSESSYSGVAVGFVYLAGFVASGASSAMYLNPATAIGIVAGADADSIVDAGSDLWIFVVGPIVGCLLAVVLFRVTNEAAYEPDPRQRWLDLLSRPIMEFMGTFFITLVAALAHSSRYAGWSAPAVGGAVLALVYAGGHVSGGHFNPAVTVGVWLSKFGRLHLRSGREDINLGFLCAYIVFQVLGGIVGAITGAYIADQSFIPGLSLTAENPVWASFLGSFLFSTLLVTAMLVSGTTRALGRNAFFGIAVGFAQIAGTSSVGLYLNPAVSLGLAARASDSNNLWIFVLAPVLGAFAAAAWYRITNENEFGRQVVQGSRRASTFGAVAPAVQEFAGTLFVAFATALAFAHRLSATSSKGWTYGIMGPGITYAVVVYLGAHVSGSHYNPALTLVTVLSRKPFGAPMKLAEFSRYSLPVYVVSQVLGALFGYMAASQLATIEFGITYTCCGGRVFGVELIGTMLLSYVFLASIYSRSCRPNSFYGVALGFGLNAMFFIATQVYGSSVFNPAVATASVIVAGDEFAAETLWLFWLAPIVGAIIGALFYRASNQQERELE